jgi:hypothetical protein
MVEFDSNGKLVKKTIQKKIVACSTCMKTHVFKDGVLPKIFKCTSCGGSTFNIIWLKAVKRP